MDVPPDPGGVTGHRGTPLRSVSPLVYGPTLARFPQVAKGNTGRAASGWSGGPAFGPIQTIILTMTVAATPVPLSEAKARLSELTRRVRQQHERITLTRNGEAEAVLLSVDDLEGMEMTLEILGDNETVGRISDSLATLGRGENGTDLERVRQDLARRRATGR